MLHYCLGCWNDKVQHMVLDGHLVQTFRNPKDCHAKNNNHRPLIYKCITALVRHSLKDAAILA